MVNVNFLWKSAFIYLFIFKNGKSKRRNIFCLFLLFCSKSLNQTEWRNERKRTFEWKETNQRINFFFTLHLNFRTFFNVFLSFFSIIFKTHSNTTRLVAGKSHPLVLVIFFFLAEPLKWEEYGEQWTPKDTKLP